MWLLVKQHPSYSEFHVYDDEWAVARKVASDTRSYTVEYRSRYPGILRLVLGKGMQRLRRLVRR